MSRFPDGSRLLEMIAIGDAYGACFEYDAPSLGRDNDLSGYPLNRAHSIGGGRYTDDTQMSIACAEVLIAGDLGTQAFADAFVSAYRRDPRVGYSRAMQAFIESCRDGADLLERIIPNSNKSGAAMRACPLGLLSSVSEVLRITELQARITHDTDDGVAAAQAAALMTHAMRFDLCERQDIPAFLEAHIGGEWMTPWAGAVGSPGLDSARAAMTSVVAHRSQAAMLMSCIDWSGDVDTVAAIAMGVSSQAKDTIRDLPDAILSGLEAGAYGVEFLRTLDRELEDAIQSNPEAGSVIRSGRQG